MPRKRIYVHVYTLENFDFHVFSKTASYQECLRFGALRSVHMVTTGGGGGRIVEGGGLSRGY